MPHFSLNEDKSLNCFLLERINKIIYRFGIDAVLFKFPLDALLVLDRVTRLIDADRGLC